MRDIGFLVKFTRLSLFGKAEASDKSWRRGQVDIKRGTKYKEHMRNRFFLCLGLVLWMGSCSLPYAYLREASPTPGPSPTPSLTSTPLPTPTPTVTPTPRPEVRLEEGQRALFNGDYDRAWSEYRSAYAEATDPEVRAAALFGLGRAAYEAREYAQALEALRSLTTSYPSSPSAARAHFLLGETYFALQRYGEAVEAYDAYLRLRPGLLDYYVWQRRGDALARLGDYAGAIAAYEQALTAPHSGDTLNLEIKIARTYADAGDDYTAIARYEQLAARTNEYYTRATLEFLTGQAYLYLGRNDLAYERFQRLVNNYPLAYDAYSALVALVNAGVPVDEFKRGLIDYQVGQYGLALEAFTRYLQANPEQDGTAYYYRAQTLIALGEYSAALSDLDVFLNNYPNNASWLDGWDTKAFLQWAYLGQPEAAAQTYLELARRASDVAVICQALMDAARNFERADRLDEAAATWARLGDEYPSCPQTPQALFWVGIARYRQGRYDEALLAFQRDLLLSTLPEDQARAQFWIGKTQQKRGDMTAAQAAWRQAAMLDPSGYYSERARDMLLSRALFAPSPILRLDVDLAAERRVAESWLRVRLNLPPETNLSDLGALAQETRLLRGNELWALGLYAEALAEFDNLREAVSADAADSYRLGNYLISLGAYRLGITALNQVLTLAGLETSTQKLTAPPYFNYCRYGTYFRDILVPIAERNSLDPLLLFSVVMLESNRFDRFAQSSAGARGLMQIMPATGEEIAAKLGWPPSYTSDDLYRPVVSLTFGAYYLRIHRDYFNGDLYAALAAYNAGPGFAAAWRQIAGDDPDLFIEVVRIAETRQYIRYIYEIFVVYRSLYGEPTP